MIVVSDTSVITALIHIERLDLLAEIFGVVVIPQAVAEELSVSHISLPAWITQIRVRDMRTIEKLLIKLDPGESEAIALAIELRADFLLMDEKLGRAAAQREGLTTIGILGVATAAKRMGLIESVAPVIRELRERASFWVSEELEQRVLREVNES